MEQELLQQQQLPTTDATNPTFQLLLCNKKKNKRILNWYIWNRTGITTEATATVLTSTTEYSKFSLISIDAENTVI